MVANCKLCSNKLTVLYSLYDTQILLPWQPHISKKDGGHLIVVPKRHIRTRLELFPFEALEMSMLSLISANILTELFSVKWFNYQENGNWSLDNPTLQHLHLHIYGRHENSTNQIYGESLIFPLKEKSHELQFENFTFDEIEKAKECINKQLKLEYIKDYLDNINKIRINATNI